MDLLTVLSRERTRRLTPASPMLNDAKRKVDFGGEETRDAQTFDAAEPSIQRLPGPRWDGPTGGMRSLNPKITHRALASPVDRLFSSKMCLRHA